MNFRKSLSLNDLLQDDNEEDKENEVNNITYVYCAYKIAITILFVFVEMLLKTYVCLIRKQLDFQKYAIVLLRKFTQ